MAWGGQDSIEELSRATA